MKHLKNIKTLIALMAICLSFASCDNNDKTDPVAFNFVGGSWVHNSNGYSEMLTFTEAGIVTSNGTEGENNTWEKQGLYLLENNVLKLIFPGEIRECGFEGKDEDNFVLYEGANARAYKRIYPIEFEKTIGWDWNKLETRIIHEEKKETYTSPNNVDLTTTALLDKIQKEFLEIDFAKAKFTETHLTVYPNNEAVEYPYIKSNVLGNEMLTINFGTNDFPCWVTGVIKMFVDGGMAIYFINDQSYKLLAYKAIKEFGGDRNDETLKAWSDSFASTFNQCILYTLYRKAPIVE